jgi:hypothetical protein
VERTRPAGRTEGSLDEPAPNMALAGMAGMAGVGRPGSGLVDDRVEAEIADELVELQTPARKKVTCVTPLGEEVASIA